MTSKPWIARYGEGLLRWRVVVLIATLLVAFGLASGAGKLGFNDDYRLFFGSENPQLQAFEALQKIYTKNDNILFVITPDGGDVFAPETLAVIEEMTRESWQIPFARRVDSITNFQHTQAEEDDLIVADLIENARLLSPEEIDEARQAALAEPLLKQRILAPSSDVTGINVTLQFPGESVDETEKAVAHARQLIQQTEAENPDIDIRLTGFVMLNNAFKESSQRDMATLVPIMYAAIALFLWFLFRSLVAMFSTLAVIALSTASAMGAAGWLGLELTPPSSIAPTLILTLAVADSVHLLKGVFSRLATGASRHQAIVEGLQLNLWPIFLTSITTAIGFLSMNFSDSPPFHDLGNITAFGVTVAFIISATFLPALISFLPIRASKHHDSSERWGRIADWVVLRRRPIFVVMGLITIGLTLAVPSNVLNDEFVDYFDERVAFRVDTDYAIDRLTGIYQIEYSLPAADSGGISDPTYLATLDRFANWWRDQPGVVHVRTLTDTMKRINRSLHADDDTFYRLPEERDLAAQYLLLYELSLPYGLDLNDEINVDKSATRFSITLEGLSARELIAAAEAGEAWLAENAPPTMEARGVGPAMMFAHLTQRNMRSMLLGTFIAVLLISGMLIFALRSLRFGLLSLIPNLAPAAMAFGLWGLAVGQVTVGLSMVVAMTLGIVVDDTVHFLAKYLRGRRELGYNAEDSVRYAFRSAGEALWTTSLVLAAGFLILSLSSFDLNAAMGKLTAVTIFLALATDFLLLPALLVTFDRKQPENEERRIRSTDDPVHSPATWSAAG